MNAKINGYFMLYSASYSVAYSDSWYGALWLTLAVLNAMAFSVANPVKERAT